MTEKTSLDIEDRIRYKYDSARYPNPDGMIVPDYDNENVMMDYVFGFRNKAISNIGSKGMIDLISSSSFIESVIIPTLETEVPALQPIGVETNLLSHNDSTIDSQLDQLEIQTKQSDFETDKSDLETEDSDLETKLSKSGNDIDSVNDVEPIRLSPSIKSNKSKGKMFTKQSVLRDSIKKEKYKLLSEMRSIAEGAGRVVETNMEAPLADIQEEMNNMQRDIQRDEYISIYQNNLISGTQLLEYVNAHTGGFLKIDGLDDYLRDTVGVAKFKRPFGRLYDQLHGVNGKRVSPGKEIASIFLTSALSYHIKQTSEERLEKIKVQTAIERYVNPDVISTSVIENIRETVMPPHLVSTIQHDIPTVLPEESVSTAFPRKTAKRF